MAFSDTYILAQYKWTRLSFIIHSYLLLERDFDRELDLDFDQDLEREREREDLEFVAEDLLRCWSCRILEVNFPRQV